jgi:hypothetical protein
LKIKAWLLLISHHSKTNLVLKALLILLRQP